MFSRLIHIRVSVLYSFSGLNHIPLYAFTTSCLPFHLVMDTGVVSPFQPLETMLLSTWVCMYVCLSLLSVLRGIFLGMELLQYMAILYLTFS